MRPLALLVALASSAAVADASAAPPRCTIPHVEGWREYRSAHFVVATDVGDGDAAKLVEELERLHALVAFALFGPDVDVPGRARVIAFADRRRFEEIAPENASGYFTTGLLGELVVFPFDDRELPYVVAHELAHRVSWHHFTRQPPWFAEGLAYFIGSVGRERDDERSPVGSRVVRGVRRSGGRWAGFASPEILWLIRGSTPVGAGELLRWDGRVDRTDPTRFHAASWVLYHWLWNNRSRQFTAFQERLAEGQAPDGAWRAAFPEWDPARPDTLGDLDRALAVYRKEGRYAPYRVDAGPVDASFRQAPLSPSDVHVLLLEARFGRLLATEEGRAALRRGADEALAEDGQNPVATWFRRAPKDEEAGALRAVTAARPGDWRGWYLLADALDARTEAGEKEAALRRAVQLAPESAGANNALAWLLVSSGRAKEARAFADRALDLAPWSPAIVDTLAAVAMGIGQCRAAVQLQQRAAEQYPPGNPQADDVRKRLGDYETRCGAAVPAAR